ncbi:MAG: hypothetical protein MJZ23_07250 [Paludibacteraceae bacterium]|nr:hypothetical protein [Paludibacteraceae bacterium]
MMYIDKTIEHRQANEINVQFIYDSNTNGWPIDDKKKTFQNFNKPKYRSQWHLLLAKEQKSRCCYCMKRLNLSNVSIEHVVPRSFSSLRNSYEFADYVRDAPVIHDNVMLADEYNRLLTAGTLFISSERRMPHIVGLTNLLLACPEPVKNNGEEGLDWLGCNCNNERGKKYLLPIMLTPKAEIDIKYGLDGSFYFSNGIEYPESRPGVQFLLYHLNSDSLKEVRFIWYKLSTTSLLSSSYLETATLKERIQFFKEAFQTNNFEEIDDRYKKYAAIGTGSQLYWNKLLAFDWFFDRYKTQ